MAAATVTQTTRPRIVAQPSGAVGLVTERSQAEAEGAAAATGGVSQGCVDFIAMNMDALAKIEAELEAAAIRFLETPALLEDWHTHIQRFPIPLWPEALKLAVLAMPGNSGKLRGVCERIVKRWLVRQTESTEKVGAGGTAPSEFEIEHSRPAEREKFFFGIWESLNRPKPDFVWKELRKLDGMGEKNCPVTEVTSNTSFKFRLVSKICGKARVPAVSQVHDIARFR